MMMLINLKSAAISFYRNRWCFFSQTLNKVVTYGVHVKISNSAMTDVFLLPKPKAEPMTAVCMHT